MNEAPEDIQVRRLGRRRILCPTHVVILKVPQQNCQQSAEAAPGPALYRFQDQHTDLLISRKNILQRQANAFRLLLNANEFMFID